MKNILINILKKFIIPLLILGVVIFGALLAGLSVDNYHSEFLEFYRGLEAYEKTDYKLAVQEIEKALEKNLSKADTEKAYIALGFSHFKLEQYDEAAAAFEQALSITPELYDIWAYLGTVYRYKSDMAKSEECLKKALEINQEYAYTYASYGMLYIDKNMPDKAIEKLKKAIELAPEDGSYHANLAIAYAKAGKFDAGKMELDMAEEKKFESIEDFRKQFEIIKSQN